MSDFTVTHVAPPEGLQAWTEPDPSQPAVAQVQAGVQMQLMERRGAWARVLFSNGWSGWVDGRRMVDAAPQPPPPQPQPQPQAQPQQAQPQQQAPPATAAAAAASAAVEDDSFSAFEPEARSQPSPSPSPPLQTPRPVMPPESPARPEPRYEEERSGPSGGRPSFDFASTRPIPALIGAAVLLLGTLFSWITISGADGNSYDVPLDFLWNHRSASGGGLKVGLVLLALAGAVAVLCFLPGKVMPRRIIGAVVVGITLLYVIQLQRALSAAGDAAPGLISALGLGVLLSFLAGAAIVYDRADTATKH